MANAKFSVVCPSCEANVSIRSSASIGKKVECPKCKYRFTVPEPEGYVDDKPKDAKKGKKKKEKSDKKSPLLFIVIGVLALGALGVGGFLLFGGDGETKPSGTTPSANSGGTTPSSGSGDLPSGESGGDPANPDGVKPKKETVKTASRPRGAAEPTNLLPGDVKGLYHVDFHLMETQANPLKRAFLDNYVRDLFKQSLAFELDSLSTYIHAMVGPKGDPFAVIQSSDSISEAALLNLKLQPLMTAGNRTAYKIVSNPMVNAMSQTFTAGTLFEILGLPGTEKVESPANPQPIEWAMTRYDDYTILVSTPTEMTKFLNSLDADGYPPFLTKLTEPPPPPPKPAPGENGNESSGEGQEYAPGEEPGMESSGETRETPQPKPTPTPKDEKTANQLVTSNPTFRTIDPVLKQMLNRIAGSDEQPFARFVEKTPGKDNPFVQRIKSIEFLELKTLDDLVMVGFAANELLNQEGKVKLYLVFDDDNSAATAVDNVLFPVLNLSRYPIGEYLDTNVQVMLGDQPNTQPGIPGSEGEFPPGEEGFPGAMTPGSEGQEGFPSPGEFEGGRESGSPGAFSPGSEEGYDPRGGGPGDPMSGFPGEGGLPGTATKKRLSTVKIIRRGGLVELDFAMEWSGLIYRDKLWPKLLRTASQFKGRMAVVAGANDWRSLAVLHDKLKEQNKPFPQGTKLIPTNVERYGLEYQPEQRVSFLAALLPHLGRNDVYAAIDRPKTMPWYDESNLGAAEAWIPEFLDASYPSESWRATHPLVEGRTVGGTNFVGIAGIGMGAARYDSKDPEQAKLIGMTGYKWGSSPADVTDGLSNTIYMMQVPPGDGRPWIAGGGATLLGIDDKLPDPFEPFAHESDKGRGTYILMGDGSVRWLKAGVDPKVFKALVTRAGGDNEAIINMEEFAPQERIKKQELQSQPAPTIGLEPKDGAVPAPVEEGEIDAEALKKFQGKWTVTEMSFGSTKVPQDFLDKIKMAMVFDDKKIFVNSIMGQNESDTIVSLTATGDKGTILGYDKPKDKTITSQYQFKDDTVTISYMADADDVPPILDLKVPKEGVLATFTLKRTK